MTRRPQPDSNRRWRWLLLFFLAGAWPMYAAEPPVGEGEPFMQYFSPRDYHGSSQCLCATQDARGVMYVGSLGEVLEYDGSAWRKIEVASETVNSLAYEASTDTIFVGARNNLGCLMPLPGGGRAFTSFTDRLPMEAQDIGSVNGTYVTPNGVYFVGTHRVLRWRDGRFQKTWEVPAASFLNSSVAANELYVSSREAGLLRVRDEELVPVSDDPLFHRAVVQAVLAEPGGALLIGTRNDGLFELKDGVVRPWKCDGGEFVKQAGIRRMLRLHDGSLAISTRSGGLLLLDPARRFRNRLDENASLRGGGIFGLFEDAEGGLWTCLESGVARVEVNSPYSVLRAGPGEDLTSAYPHGHWFGSTVLGADTGIYRVVAADPATATGAHLERLPGTNGSSTAMCSVENGILTLSKGQIFLLDRQASLVPMPMPEIDDPNDLCASQVHPGRVYVIGSTGKISALRLDAETQHWVYDGPVAALGMADTSFGLYESTTGDLWVQTLEHGLHRVELPADGPARVTSYFDRPGPLRGYRLVGVLGGGGWTMRFIGASPLCGLDASEREVLPLTEFGERFRDGSLRITGGASCSPDNLWVIAKDQRAPPGEMWRGRVDAGGPGRTPVFRPLPAKIDEVIGQMENFIVVDTPPKLTSLLILGSTGNGIVRLDVPRWEAQPPPKPFATFIRRAAATGGDAPAAPILNEPLPFARNTAHFEFAAATMGLGAAPRFQTRLANFGAGEWSNFTDHNSVDYLNLPEGRYVFEVRARNSDGQLGSVAALPFRVLPPWRRSLWAYAVYALLVASALVALIRWRDWQLRRRNAALTALVDARTGELRAREADLLSNERHLVRARDDAETANRAKSAFLANMSHELRTPLNAILGYAQVLLKQADLPDRSREQITVIGQSGGHLLSLINEVLDLSKIEAGKLTLSLLDFPLRQLLDEVSAAFRPRFAEKGLTFTETRAPDLPAVVRTDSSRLRQVLFNLLSNAVKFTRQGDVSLEVRPVDAGRVRFEVRDTGVGIGEGELRDIFLAFHQVGERSLAAQGTGLGLGISQRLVGLLGGKIEVVSTPGEGSCFWFDLPLPPVQDLAGLLVYDFADPAQRPVIGYEGAQRRLLLVDDLPENRRVLRDFLQPLGFEIEKAASGANCLDACARRMPDAVLLDLRLGVMDGFEVARTLRAMPGGGPVGIIAISASVFESDRQQAIDAGCDDFLPKPFEEAQLLSSLGRVLGLRWVRAGIESPAPASAGALLGEAGTPPSEEVRALLDFSLRGDIVGLRKHLETLRAAGVSDGLAILVRQLEPLVVNYQMDEIHALLLAHQADHDRRD